MPVRDRSMMASRSASDGEAPLCPKMASKDTEREGRGKGGRREEEVGVSYEKST